MFDKIFHSKKVSESLIIALVMAVVGGYLDIYTYLCRGKVFANTQTGNLVLLGHHIAQGNIDKIFYYIMPILAFMIGVGLVEWLEQKWKDREISWHQVALIIEMIVLLIVYFIPLGSYDVLANILVSYTCGLQVQTFRKVNKLSYSSTMFTGNVKNAAERLSNYAITKDLEALESCLIYLLIIIMFVVGGVVGSLFIEGIERHSIVIVLFLLAIVYFIVHKRKGVNEM